MAQTLTLTLPDSVVSKLQRTSEVTYRSLDDIVAGVVETTLTENAELPAALGAELAAMRLFSDEALWAATQPSISLFEQERLAQLNETAHERSLSQAEEMEQQALLNAYNRSMLRRAQALALLKQRGHDISPALQPLQDD